MDTGAWLATESDMTEHTGLTTLLVCSQDTVAWRKCGRGQRMMGEVLASLTHMIPCKDSPLLPPSSSVASRPWFWQLELGFVGWLPCR